jgi:hypothetical protein
VALWGGFLVFFGFPDQAGVGVVGDRATFSLSADFFLAWQNLLRLA